MATKSTDWRPGPTVCRCCLTEGCYKDISTEYFWMGKREVYAEMLSDTFNVSISYSKSGGPNSNSRLICEPCISRLRDASDFRRQVLECEKTFMQHLDPGSSSVSIEVENIIGRPLGNDVKLERVKLEKSVSDDDDEFDCGFPDDDDDDLDDQPLTTLASKIPKKETVDIMDLLDNAKAAEKRKSTTKLKSSPTKKTKIVKKEVKLVKPGASKTTTTVEKKKKEFDPVVVARQNAKILLRYSTAYPFKIPSNEMVCVYCCEGFEEPHLYRKHMKCEHTKFNINMAFQHTVSSEEIIKVDCTELQCRLCPKKLQSISRVAEHLKREHNKSIDLDAELGIMVFILGKELFHCAMCPQKFPSLRALSRHSSRHYHKYTCETCGNSYISKENLNKHILFSHSKEKICIKCKKSFPNNEARRAHVIASRRCWGFTCSECGERFVSRKDKVSHLAEVHNKDLKKKLHTCPECSEQFTEWKLYRSHYIISHTDTNFVCAFCGCKFESKTVLEQHKLIHTKEKMFHCTGCPKSFVRLKNLRQHEWLHNENKRFKCDPCNKQFNQRVSWKSHMRSYHPELVDF